MCWVRLSPFKSHVSSVSQPVPTSVMDALLGLAQQQQGRLVQPVVVLPADERLSMLCLSRCGAQAFFAQIYSEAQSSRAAPGHVAIAELHRMGRLQRHYTLNIDGLAAVSSASPRGPL